MPPLDLNPLVDINVEEQAFLDAENRWLAEARPKQIIPLDGWSTIFARCGRGWGKTRVGAAWIRREAWLYPGIILHVVAPTYSDLHGVIFEGESGLLSAIPPEMIESYGYSPYPHIIFRNGSRLRGFSSEVPNRLRGPQAHRLWGDEVAAWQRAEACLDNINFSTRLAYRHSDGRLIQPQKLYTTTPKPVQWISTLAKEATQVITGSTHENRANLADDFYERIAKYEGTQIGRQEVYGEILDISESAIIRKSWIRMWPADQPMPWLEFIMLGFDTAFTEKTWDDEKLEQDPTAFGAWGVFLHERKWNLMLLNSWDDYLGFPDLVDKAKKEWKLVYGRRQDMIYKPVVGPGWFQEQVKRPDLMVIEDKGSGISLRQVMSREANVECHAYNPGKADKTSRLHMVSHLFRNGRIWIPESKNMKGEFRPWANNLLDQLCVYSGPGTTIHDDYVDMTSMCVRVFSDKFVTEGTLARIPPQATAQGNTLPAEVLPEDRDHPDYVPPRPRQPRQEAY